MMPNKPPVLAIKLEATRRYVHPILRVAFQAPHLFVMQEIGPTASHMLGKHSTMEIHPQPPSSFMRNTLLLCSAKYSPYPAGTGFSRVSCWKHRLSKLIQRRYNAIYPTPQKTLLYTGTVGSKGPFAHLVAMAQDLFHLNRCVLLTYILSFLQLTNCFQIHEI